MSETPSQTVSLNDIGQRYIGMLQHLGDLAVFSWAGARMVNEQTYDETFHSVAGLPSTPMRLPFEAAKAESARWLLKNSLGEVLNLSLVFLEDIRKVCGLIAFNAAKASASGDLVALAAEINADNGPLDIPTRLGQLKSRYGLTIALEPEILSLVAVLRSFAQTGGILPKGASLTVQLKAVQPPAEGSAEPRLADYRRTWNAGERIGFSREEHAAVFTTASVFISSMLGAVQEFAKRSGIADASAPAPEPSSAQ